MRLIITRHGESEENSLRILQGLLPGKLSQIGVSQVNKLGNRLSQEKIDYVYCSPVERCQETLSIIQTFIGPKITSISDLIQERDFGQMRGKKLDEINFDQLDLDTPENRALGIESLDNVRTRTKQFLDEIKLKHPNDNILVVSHSNPIRMLLAELLNKTFQQILTETKISNASISIFDYSNNSVKPIIINDVEHLI